MRVHAREWAVLVGHSRGRAPTRVQFPPRTQEPTDSQSIKRAPPTTAHAHASAAPVIWTQFPAPCPADPKTAVVCSLAQAARPWLLLPWPPSVSVCVHACMHACMTYAWVCVSICICMCVHVYTHTCISIHLPPPSFSLNQTLLISLCRSDPLLRKNRNNTCKTRPALDSVDHTSRLCTLAFLPRLTPDSWRMRPVA